MSDHEEKHLELDHEYDGIKELDYPLPMWWLITFYGAIVFGIGYFIYYQLGSGPNLLAEYKKDYYHHKSVRDAYLEKLGEFDQEKFTNYYSSKEMVDYGSEVFANNCQACHAERGAGDIGPNLTDEYWLYADGTPETIYPFVLGGNPTGGMPAWQGQLSEDELYAVMAYIMSIQGTTHANPKKPQGEHFPRN